MIEPPEVPHAGHHKSSIKWFDIAMATGVLAVSLGSLYVALHTGHTMEQLVAQNERLVHAQSTPILQFSTGNEVEGEPVLEGDVVNVGSGTARVMWVRFTHEGQTFTKWPDLIRKLIGGPIRSPVTTAELEQTTLSVGETRDIFTWPKPEEARDALGWAKLNRERWQVRSTACFCSVFDECWTSHMGADLPVRVESCEVPRPVAASKPSH